MTKESFELNHSWQFKEFPESARRIRDLEPGDWLECTVPSSIFSCLLQNNLINKKELALGPEALSWVSEKSWIFRKEFDVPAAVLDKEHIEILFNGLDTAAHIWLNEKLIGKTDNMFIPHRFDIKPYLKQTNNTLYVKLISARKQADKLLNRYGQLGTLGERDPHSSYIRKAAYQFGSAFGSSVPGCGIFRNVRIEAANIAAIDNVHLRTVDCNQHNADVRVALSIRRTNRDGCRLQCRVQMTGGGLDIQQQLRLGNDNDTISTILHIDRPFLWWPHGYGVQHLYHIRVELLTEDGQLLDIAEQDFGVRSVRVEKSAQKTQLYINDEPIHIKAADWMPLSLLPGTETADEYEDILRQAKSCHLNLLHVWAGGFYESSEFYGLCDRMGILVWQTFMFDSAYYPDRQFFLDSIREEAEIVLKQLRNHTCLVLWCGNSNVDYLHKNRKLGKGRKFYGKSIFHKLLPKLIHELDPDREYIPTAVEANDKNCPLLYPGPEIPSLPNMRSLAVLTEKVSFETINKITSGYTTLQRISQYQVPEFFPAQSISEYIWQSQVVQARLIQNTIEKIRAIDLDGSNCGIGVMKSPAFSINTAMIDAQNEPKALYYYAKRFLRPILVTVRADEKSGLLKAYAVNDSASPVTGTLHCQAIDTSGHILDNTEMPLRISPFSKSGKINLPKALSNLKEPTRSFLYICIKNNDVILAENTFFYCWDKEFQWPIADIDIQIAADSEKPAWNVKLTCESVIRDLQIIPPQPARLNDNFLTLLPNQPKEIQVLYEKTVPSIRTPLKLFNANQACSPNR